MTLSNYARALADPRLLAVMLFGFASGLPLALTGQALQAWLTVDGVELTTIGLFTLVGQPYTYKFLWAPLMDRFEPPFLGRRRGWLVTCQLLLALAILYMSTLDPSSQIVPFAIIAALVAFLSASQDVVVDAYRTDAARSEQRGVAAALGVLGYRVAMLVSGGLAFVLAEQKLGWPGTYRLIAFLMLGLAAYTCLAPRILDEPERSESAQRDFIGFAGMLLAAVLAFVVSYLLVGVVVAPVLAVTMSYLAEMLWLLLPSLIAIGAAYAAARALRFSAYKDVLGFGWMAVGVQLGYFLAQGLLRAAGVHAGGGDQWVGLAILVTEIVCAVPMALLAAYLADFRLLLVPMRGYFSRESAWTFLLFIILYKLGDAFAGTLSTTFLLKGVGFSQTEVGVANKIVGLFATIVGSLVGGLLMVRLRLWLSLLIFGLLQVSTNLGYWWLAVAGKGALGALHWGTDWMRVFFGGKAIEGASASMDVLLIIAVLLENLAGGMGTAALVAFLMALCSDRRATATQFALLSALAAIGRVYVGPSSGYLVQAFGWADFFVFSFVMGLPALLLLLYLRKPVQELERVEPPPVERRYRLAGKGRVFYPRVRPRPSGG